MKTPEEIKNALECCRCADACTSCPYSGQRCAITLADDALEYIRQLEAATEDPHA